MTALKVITKKYTFSLIKNVKSTQKSRMVKYLFSFACPKRRLRFPCLLFLSIILLGIKFYTTFNLSRFLPPGSYLNAQQQSPEDLAKIMNNLINSPKEYSRYFNWKYYYTYHSPEAIENVCRVCAALNNRTMVENTTVYNHFRSWWAPNYRNLCLRNTRTLF